MKFSVLVERQKRLIRSRHEGETFLLEKGEVIPVSQTDRMLAELNSLKGLNTRERAKAATCA